MTPHAVGRSIGEHARRLMVCVLALGMWLTAVALGARAMTDYETEPGEPADPPIAWPTASALPRHATLPTLVVFAHPRCPCTRATLAELDRIMERLHDRVAADVVFLRPSELPGRWTRSPTWRRARDIPGVTVLADRDGDEARRFGARTSGQVLLYDRDGRLVFDGGITPSRGHEGDGTGRRQLVALLTDATAAHASSRVFGCALFAPPVQTTREESQP